MELQASLLPLTYLYVDSLRGDPADKPWLIVICVLLENTETTGPEFFLGEFITPQLA